MRKRPAPHLWPYIVGVVAVIAVLTWVQFSIKSLGNELDQTRSDNAALANQVRSLGGQPVAEGKPGQRGDAGPQGPQGVQGIQGPPGIQGPRGPIGITGQSPACLLEPSRCVGPKGATGSKGSDGADGTQGPQGDTGAAGTKGDQGVPGVAGKDGVDGQPGVDGTNGTDGKDGAPGADGRGIKSVTCQSDGSWLFAFTDGTTQSVDGPCRAAPLLGNN